MKRKSSMGWRDLHDLTLMVSQLRKMAPKNSHGQPGMLGDLLDPNDFSGCESLLEAYFLQVNISVLTSDKSPASIHSYALLMNERLVSKT